MRIAVIGQSESGTQKRSPSTWQCCTSTADRVRYSATGDLARTRLIVEGATYRGGVKKTVFSGGYLLVETLRAYGADVNVDDPMYNDAELQALGFVPHRRRASVDVEILQSDHEEYRELGLVDFPVVRVVLDGRAFLDAARFPEVAFLTLGSG